MKFVGLDVHKRQSTFCVLNDDGSRHLMRTVHGSADTVVKALTEIKEPLVVCFEASTGYGPWWDRLQPIARKVVVAHPGHLHLISRSKHKNDRNDAEKLAHLLRLDILRSVHVPGRSVRAWRRAIEHRQRLVRHRTRTKNQIRTLLHSLAITPPRSLWTRTGLAWLEPLSFEDEADALQRDILLQELRTLIDQIARVEKMLNRIAQGHPEVALLRTIPGVGPRTAEAVVAAIDDPARFTKNKAIGNYFGMVPSQDASAGRNRLGHITRQGPAVVRHLVTEAVWQAVRCSPTIRAYFERIEKGDATRKKTAVVATGHYLLRVMLSMLQKGETWREAQP